MKRHLYLSFAIFIALLWTLTGSVPLRAQNAQESVESNLAREIARQIALDSGNLLKGAGDLLKGVNGAFLYQHSDGYRNEIRYRARKALEQQNLIVVQTPNEDIIPLSLDSKDISNDKSDQNETTIAINRKNPNLIIAGSNDGASQDLQMPVYVTNDGGQTWHTSRLPALPEDRLATSDPVIAADASGHFYYAFLTFPKYSALPIQLVVAVSTDGVNWTDMQPVGVQQAERSFQDKPSIVADNSPASPYFGRVYLAWTVLTDDKPSDGIRLAYSDDAGKNWSVMKVMTTGINNSYSQLCTGKNGEVFLSYSSLDDSMHELMVSTDGGDTFDSICINAYNDYPTTNEGRSGLKGSGGFRASPFATIRADLATNRLHAVYGNWVRWSATDSSAELLYTYSDNLGATWSVPAIVGDRPEQPTLVKRDHFFPWLAYDEYTHETSMLYYSSEQDSNNLGTMPYRMAIGPGGPGIGIAIGDSLFNPLYSGTGFSAPFLGDYIGSDVFHNEFAAAWTENRPGHTDGDVFAYVGVTDSTFSSVGTLVKLNADRLWLSSPYPNPIRAASFKGACRCTVNFTLPEAGLISLDIFSTSGEFIKPVFRRYMVEGSYIESLDLSSLASGDYFLRLSSNSDRAPLLVESRPLAIVAR
jgi:hypothetical protein